MVALSHVGERLFLEDRKRGGVSVMRESGVERVVAILD